MTALYERHSARLRHWEVDGMTRYSRMLGHMIADGVRRERKSLLGQMMLTAIYNRAIAKRDEVLADVTDDLSEDDQRAIFDKVLRFQSIADQAKEALNGD